MRRAAPLAVLLLAAIASADDAKEQFVIDQKASELTLFVKKKGALKAFAHDHDIAARVFTGTVVWVPSEPERSRVDFKVSAKELAVVDSELSREDRDKVQATMLSDEVLDAARFPEITFVSQSVVAHPKTADGKQQLAVLGKLTLKGATRLRTLEVIVSEKDGAIEVTGEHELKQTDFGIEPYSTGFGTIGVQDAVQVRFKIVARS